VRDGRVVKGTSFVGLRDVGDPVELAQRYEAEGADEIVFLDISASAEGRTTLLDTVRRTAERLFIPLTVGGGIGDVDDIANVLRAGADKVSINTTAVLRPEIIGEASRRFGSQCIVASIDALREERVTELATRAEAGGFPGGGEPGAPWYRVFTHGGRKPTELDAMDWARHCTALGAGEVLVTSIDQDGQRTGYDLALTGAISEAVTVPVIASGGAGTPGHVRDAFQLAGADAALLAGILHDGLTTVRAIKAVLVQAGIAVRPVPEVSA
jgi:cyclase